MASAYAFQEGGHVAVDMLRNAADRFDKTGKQIPRRAMAVLGYLMALFFICVMFYGAWELFQKSIVLNRLSTLSPQIPMWILYLPMMIGSVFMAITLVFMILDCLSQDSDGKYL
jgi:TRAP-type C4-dicarboxylate transport system permease small subunit